MTSEPHLKIKLQIMCGDDIAIGPGKADLLEAIAMEGSISAGGRRLGMSYRRAWLLVDTMNRCWREPLVTTSSTGSGKRGAQLTDFGHEVLRHFRRLQAATVRAGDGEDWGKLSEQVLSQPRIRQKR